MELEELFSLSFIQKLNKIILLKKRYFFKYINKISTLKVINEQL